MDIEMQIEEDVSALATQDDRIMSFELDDHVCTFHTYLLLVLGIVRDN